MKTVGRRACAIVGASALQLGWNVPARAQLLQDAQTVVIPPEPPITTARSAFQQGGGEISVAERMLPAFSATGITVGAFDIYPGLPIEGLYDSNVFADNDRKQSSAVIVVRPELTARTSAGPYLFEVYGRGNIRHNFSQSTESTEEVLGGADGSVAIGALSSVTAGVSYASLIDPRTASDSPRNARKPLEYRDLEGFVGTTIEGAGTRLVLRADVGQLRFSDAERIGGGPLFTRDRDRTRYAGLARLERAISPSFSLYVAGTVNAFDYRLATASFGNRDSSGFGAFVGSRFEVTRIVRGDIRLGYIRQNFDQRGARPIAGFGALGNLIVSPNRLWTFTLNGESTVQDTGVPGTLGLFHQGGSIRADNELRRYLILSLEAEYFTDTYRGLPRRDKIPAAEVAATYLSQHHWNARLGYRYLARHSNDNIQTADFDDHRVSATLTFQY